MVGSIYSFIHFLFIQTDRTHQSARQPLFNIRFTGAKIRLFFHLTINNLQHLYRDAWVIT